VGKGREAAWLATSLLGARRASQRRCSRNNVLKEKENSPDKGREGVPEPGNNLNKCREGGSKRLPQEKHKDLGAAEAAVLEPSLGRFHQEVSSVPSWLCGSSPDSGLRG
jgi:hypothetical protein